jgi:hypothetical protein
MPLLLFCTMVGGETFNFGTCSNGRRTENVCDTFSYGFLSVSILYLHCSKYLLYEVCNRFYIFLNGSFREMFHK